MNCVCVYIYIADSAGGNKSRSTRKMRIGCATSNLCGDGRGAADILTTDNYFGRKRLLKGHLSPPPSPVSRPYPHNKGTYARPPPPPPSILY